MGYAVTECAATSMLSAVIGFLIALCIVGYVWLAHKRAIKQYLTTKEAIKYLEAKRR